MSFFLSLSLSLSLNLSISIYLYRYNYKCYTCTNTWIRQSVRQSSWNIAWVLQAYLNRWSSIWHTYMGYVFSNTCWTRMRCKCNLHNKCFVVCQVWFNASTQHCNNMWNSHNKLLCASATWCFKQILCYNSSGSMYLFQQHETYCL